MFKSLSNRIRNFFTEKAVILMYHQVAERRTDPWELAVSPDNFAAQLEEINKTFNVVPLEELATAVRQRKLKHKLLAITFDDGFRDNYTTAKPILESQSSPATFFISTNTFSESRTFWWEELESLVLHAQELPTRIQLNRILPFEFTFSHHAKLTPELDNEIRSWRTSTEPRNERTLLFIQLWKTMQPLTFDQQLQMLNELRECCEAKERSIPEVMSKDDLRALAQGHLFSIGAHTVHHAMLGAQTKENQQSEIVRSKDTLEKVLNTKINLFAYPYGNYNQTTTMLLKDAGFQSAVNTRPGVVTHDDSIFELPRIQVKNWKKSAFTKELNQIVRL